MKKMRTNKLNEVYSSLRKDWGNLNPSTKIYKDRTKYNRKKKHKEKYDVSD